MDTFQVGSVLAMSVRAIARNFAAFIAGTALFFFPVIFYAHHWIDGVGKHEGLGEVSIGGFTMIVTALALLASGLVSATLTYGVAMDMAGRRVGAGDCVAKGLRSTVSVIGLMILAAIAIVGSLLLLIFPGVIVACMLYVAVPALVIERPGIIGAMRRSRELTAGRKAQIFGMLFLIGFFKVVIQKVTTAALPVATVDDVKRLLYFQLGSEAIFGAFGAVVAAVTYCVLRTEKEGSLSTRLDLFDPTERFQASSAAPVADLE